MQSRALLDGQLAGCGDLDFSFGLVTGGGLAVFNFPVAETLGNNEVETNEVGSHLTRSMPSSTSPKTTCLPDKGLKVASKFGRSVAVKNRIKKLLRNRTR